MDVPEQGPPRQPYLSALTSRFGRRLLALFIGCALVPTVLLALVSYASVSRQLEIQGRERLREAAEGVGMTVLERLIGAQADLADLAARGMLPSRLPAPDVVRFDRKVNGIVFVPRTGEERALLGRIPDASDIVDAVAGEVAPGQTLLYARRSVNDLPQTFLVSPASQGGRSGALVVALDVGYLWGGLRSTALGPDMELLVVDDSARVLYGPDGLQLPPALTARLGDGSGELAWSAEQTTWLAGYRSLHMRGRFVTPPWTIVLREPRSSVLAPIAQLRRTFPLILLACIVGVVLLSLLQIRRGLQPLQALQEGTRRIARRDFEGRVAVRSRDEFAELASSFNSMAGTLAQQFRALGTAADVDRAVLSAIDALTIVDTILGRAPDVYPCDLVGVTLLVDGAAAHSFVQDGTRPGGRRIEYVALTPEAAAALRAETERIVSLDDAPPSHLGTLAELGARHALVIPLVFQDDLIGFVAFATRHDAPADTEARTHARRLAAQAAVGLANARMVEQVRSLAFFDGVTGLPNRLFYRELLARALARARREGGRVGICFVDLDHFGRINDTLGHEVGDQLLREVAARLARCCRESDGITRMTSDEPRPDVARWGGDEFTIVLPDLNGAHDAIRIVQRILDAFAQPFQLAGIDVFVAASVGVALAPEDGEDAETLLRHADVAMYYAKEQGRNSFSLFSPAMNSAAVERLALEQDLRRAVQGSELVLHFQPIVEAGTARIVAAEALVRWQHPQRGLLPPLDFIGIAEESGLVLPIGEWILRSACRQLREWRDEGLAMHLSVNVSGRQLRDPTLTDTIIRVLGETGIEPEWLTLELTESLLMEQQEQTVTLLQRWRDMGLGLSVDDFGTGYSSLSYLKHFPFDTLKIDRTFLHDVASGGADAAITRAVLALGHALDLKIVGEGVETTEQLAFLREHGCDLIQGFLMSRPLTADEMTRRLRDGRPLTPSAVRLAG
jgi:diguanylate cyclase (GGDEF)-like protein